MNASTENNDVWVRRAQRMIDFLIERETYTEEQKQPFKIYRNEFVLDICESNCGSVGNHCGITAIINSLRTHVQREAFIGYDYELPVFAFAIYIVVLWRDAGYTDEEIARKVAEGYVNKDFHGYLTFLEKTGIIEGFVWTPLHDFQINKIFCTNDGPAKGIYLFFGQSYPTDKREACIKYMRGPSNKPPLNTQQQCERYYSFYMRNKYYYGHATCIVVEEDRQTMWVYDSGKNIRKIATPIVLAQSIVGHTAVYKFDLIVSGMSGIILK